MTVTPVAWWPMNAVACFEDLITYRLVGASACADRITSALVSVAFASQSAGRDVESDVREAGVQFSALKPDTALYQNISNMLTRAAADGVEELADQASHISDYRRLAQEKVVADTVGLLADSNTLLIHDYSSMVLRIVRHLGDQSPRRVVVTSGEPLGQGQRVAKEVADAGHQVIYSPDMSVARIIDEVDSFLTGVETFYLDGSLANTVGTLMLSLLCRERGVQVLAPTETLKVAIAVPSVVEAPLLAHLLDEWPRSGFRSAVGWDVVPFVLDAVPAELISTYVTETATCAPPDVGDAARQGLVACRL